jgi:hypothetical protein
MRRALKRSIYVSNEIRFLLGEKSCVCIYYASASSAGVSLTKNSHWDTLMKMSLFIFYQSRWWEEVRDKWRMDIHTGSPNTAESLLAAKNCILTLAILNLWIYWNWVKQFLLCGLQFLIGFIAWGRMLMSLKYQLVIHLLFDSTN